MSISGDKPEFVVYDDLATGQRSVSFDGVDITPYVLHPITGMSSGSWTVATEVDGSSYTTSSGTSLTKEVLEAAQKELDLLAQKASDPISWTATSGTWTTASTSGAWSSPLPRKPRRSSNVTHKNFRPVWGSPLPMDPESIPETHYSVSPILAYRRLVYNNSWFTGHYSGEWNLGMHEAKCSQPHNHLPGETAPAWFCNCGIYAHHKPELTSGALLTLVAMEGVIEHKLGYRARRAWVVACAWEDFPGFSPWAEESERKRANLLIKSTWPIKPMICRSEAKLAKVKDFYDKNPDDIPVPTEEMWDYYHDKRRHKQQEGDISF